MNSKECFTFLYSKKIYIISFTHHDTLAFRKKKILGSNINMNMPTKQVFISDHSHQAGLVVVRLTPKELQ